MSPRFLLRPNALLYVRLVPALAAGLLLMITAATSQLPPLARGASTGFIIASVLIAFLPKRNDVKTHGSITLAIIAVAAVGQTHTGLEYAIGSGLFALLVLACLRAPLTAARMRAATTSRSDGRPADPIHGGGRRRTALVVLVVVATAIATSLVTALPRVSAYVEREVQRLAGDVASEDDQVGFNTKVRVGSLRHMLQSDRVVMRISGEPVEYLRGMVLDRYDARIWMSTQAETTTSVPANAPLDRTTTHIDFSRAALAGRVAEPRWFLPEDACNVHTASGRVALDAHRTAHPDPSNDTREISFARERGNGACMQSFPAEAKPDPIDLRMAEVIRQKVTPVAIAWTRGHTTDREAVDAIIRELSRFRYSLDDRREGEVDPVVEFLTITHAGHCELFASALALLARSIGISTRLVVGYRVDEVNPFTKRSVVRDRNAHTWVEAWIDDRWQTFDPTPIAEVHDTTRPSRWENIAEALSFVWDSTIGFFAKIGLVSAGVIFAAMAAVLLIVRSIQRRRMTAGRDVVAASRPLPAFVTLTTALARVGWERADSEPLERFARRVDGSGEPWSSDVADVLTRYAELRYGGIGEERTIAQRLDELARKVSPAS